MKCRFLKILILVTFILIGTRKQYKDEQNMPYSFETLLAFCLCSSHILNSKSQPVKSTIKFKNAIIAGATYPSADVFTPSTEPQ